MSVLGELPRVEEAAESMRELVAVQANVLIPGIYAWAITVAAPAMAAGVPIISRASGALSLAALIAGPLLVRSYPRLGRALGVHAFLGFALLCWTWLRHAGLALGAQPLEAAFGALGFLFYAFGWGELSARRRVPERDPAVLGGAELLPRGKWPRSSALVLAIGVLGASTMVCMGFLIARPLHAVMAHSLAIVFGLVLVGSAARVAVERAPRALPSDAERFNAAASWLAALIIALALGALYWMLGQ